MAAAYLQISRLTRQRSQCSIGGFRFGFERRRAMRRGDHGLVQTEVDLGEMTEADEIPPAILSGRLPFVRIAARAIIGAHDDVRDDRELLAVVRQTFDRRRACPRATARRLVRMTIALARQLPLDLCTRPFRSQQIIVSAKRLRA